MAPIKFVKYTKPLRLKSKKAPPPKPQQMDASVLSPNMMARARYLLGKLHDLEWNALGEIVYRGKLWPKSNISKILFYHFKKSGQKPVYYGNFVKIINPWTHYE